MNKKIYLIMLLFIATMIFSSCGNEKTETKTKENAPTKVQCLNDKRFRQAMMYAIDMKTITKELFYNKAVRAISLMPDDDWRVSGLNSYEYNPQKAKELIEEVGWDSDYSLDLVYYYGDQATVDFLLIVQNYLNEVGIKMVSRKLEGDIGAQLNTPPKDFIKGPSAVSWDIAYVAIGALAPHEFYSQFSKGGSNSHTQTTPEIEKMIKAINDTAIIEEQKKGFYELEKYDNEMLLSLPLFHQPLYIIESDRLSRGNVLYGNELFNYDWDIINWDIAANKDGIKILKSNSGAVDFFEHPFGNVGKDISKKVLFDHLLVADNELIPTKTQLAKEYSVSEDSLSFEFILKDNLLWHDGSEITTQDIKGTFELASKIVGINTVILDMIKSLQGYDDYINNITKDISGIVIDGNKITFNFASISPNALLIFSQFAPLPMKYFSNTDPLKFQQDEFWQKPIGSGPYKIKEVSLGNYSIFEKFEDYHGGVAKIDEIHMYASNESDPNFVKNVLAGNVDFAYTKNIEDIITLEKEKNLKITPVNIRYTRFFTINKFDRLE